MNSKERVFISLFMLAAIGFIGGDAYEDLSHGSSGLHVMMEGIILICLVIGVIIIWRQLIVAKLHEHSLSLDLNRAQVDLENYRKKTEGLSQGLAKKIDEQLEAWALTRAEKEVALLMLKGLASKEIADIRQTSEKTIRQQSTAIYKKSNLANRQELAAFFLEDLLVLK